MSEAFDLAFEFFLQLTAKSQRLAPLAPLVIAAAKRLCIFTAICGATSVDRSHRSLLQTRRIPRRGDDSRIARIPPAPHPAPNGPFVNGPYV